MKNRKRFAAWFVNLVFSMWTLLVTWSNPTKFKSRWTFEHCCFLLIFMFEGKLLIIFKITGFLMFTIIYRSSNKSCGSHCDVFKKFTQNWMFSLFCRFKCKCKYDVLTTWCFRHTMKKDRNEGKDEQIESV